MEQEFPGSCNVAGTSRPEHSVGPPGYPPVDKFEIKQEEKIIIDNQIANEHLMPTEQVMDDSVKVKEEPKDGPFFCPVYVKEEPMLTDSMKSELDDELIFENGVQNVQNHSISGGHSGETDTLSGTSIVPQQSAATTEEVHGLINNKTVYHQNDGYFYGIIKFHKHRAHVKCAINRRCPGRASMPTDPAQRLAGSLRITRQHDHRPDMIWLTIQQARKKMLERSVTEATPLRDIYSQELEGLPAEVAGKLPFKQVSKTMRRLRCNARIPELSSSCRGSSLMTENVFLGQMNTVHHSGDGFLYIYPKSDTTNLVCAVKGCPGKALVTDQIMSKDPLKKKQTLKITVQHNHLPDADWLTVLKVRTKILERCGAETTPVLDIYKEETQRLDPKLSSYPELLLKNLHMTMHSWSKDKSRPKKETITIPSDLQHYGLLLETLPRFSRSKDNEPFYRATVVDEDNDAAVIFISEASSEVMPKAKQVEIDTTFKVMPESPQCDHLLVMAPVYQEMVLPTVFVLMSNKTESLYKLVLTFIQQYFPEWQPEIFTTDYNGVLQTTLRQLWPAAAIVGTWSHAANSMMVKWNRLGHRELFLTDRKASQVVKMCQALPLLPCDRTEEGYEHIVEYAERSGVLQQLVVFLSYVHRVWIKGVGAETFSVYRQKKRTFTYMEIVHRRLRDSYKKLPFSIWMFTDAIRNAEKLVSSLFKSQSNLKSNFTKAILGNKTLVRFSSDLARGCIEVGRFLELVTHHLECYYSQVYNVPDGATSEDENFEGLENSTLPPDIEISFKRKRRKKSKKKPHIEIPSKRKRRKQSKKKPRIEDVITDSGDEYVITDSGDESSE